MAAWFTGKFPARAGDDRTAVLAFVIIDTLAVIAGFGTNSYRHIAEHGLDYPLIVHLHAVTFSSWLALFNVQVWLIRRGRPDLHRRLGTAMAFLACWMLVLGPTTAIIRDIAQAPPGEVPVFLSVQFTDMIAFGSLTFAALFFRVDPPTHKRLMLMALFYVSDAGFARLVNGWLAAPLGDSPAGLLVGLYGMTNLLALAWGAYDLARYRRLHRAYAIALAWILALQALAIYLLISPGWKMLLARMYGL